MKMDRREMIKVSLLSGGAVLLSVRSASAQAVELPTGGVFDPPSPPTRPFQQELPRMRPKIALGTIDDLLRPENGSVLPNGTVFPQITGQDALTTYAGQTERIVASHQLLLGQFHPQKFYVLKAQQNTHVFHPDPPYDNGSIIWGYDGIYPGPTFTSRYGQPILVRIFNDLYDDPAANLFVPGGFGDAQISTHLHNGHTGSESDGNPEDIYPRTPLAEGNPNPQYPTSILALRFRDHHYAMFAAGIDSTKARRQCAGDAKAMINLPQKQRATVATQMSAGKIRHHFA